jgi:hypothetical protein
LSIFSPAFPAYQFSSPDEFPMPHSIPPSMSQEPQQPKDYERDYDSEHDLSNRHLAAAPFEVTTHFADRVPLLLSVAPNLIGDLYRTGVPHTLNLRKRKWPVLVAILGNPVKVRHLWFVVLSLSLSASKPKADLIIGLSVSLPDEFPTLHSPADGFAGFSIDL